MPPLGLVVGGSKCLCFEPPQFHRLQATGHDMLKDKVWLWLNGFVIGAFCMNIAWYVIVATWASRGSP